MSGRKPNQRLYLWLPLYIHDGGSGYKLTDGPNVKMVHDACLWLDHPWFK